MVNCLLAGAVAVLVAVCVPGCGAQQSPCPQYFNYHYDGQTYYASISVPPPQPGGSLRVELMMSIKAPLPDVRSGSIDKI